MVMSTQSERAALKIQEEAIVEEPVVTLLFPDQIMEVPVPLMRTETDPVPPPPPPPKPKERSYLRTTQNEAAETAPANAAFISDRNTRAGSKLAPDPDGVANMPTLDGKGPAQMELADRDYKDGKIKDDAATAQEAAPAPATSGGGGMSKPTPVPPPQPVVVAKAQPIPAATPVIEDLVREKPDGGNEKMPLEIKRAQPPNSPNATASQPTPSMLPPGLGSGPDRAAGAPDPVKKTAGKPDPESFSPFTRTSQVKGTISNRADAAVDAEMTPTGKYTRQVIGPIEQLWHKYYRQHRDAGTGTVEIRIRVPKSGKVTPADVEILTDAKQANSALIEFTLKAILDADIPPIPKDLLPLLEDERFITNIDVLIY